MGPPVTTLPHPKGCCIHTPSEALLYQPLNSIGFNDASTLTRSGRRGLSSANHRTPCQPSPAVRPRFRRRVSTSSLVDHNYHHHRRPLLEEQIFSLEDRLPSCSSNNDSITSRFSTLILNVEPSRDSPSNRSERCGVSASYLLSREDIESAAMKGSELHRRSNDNSESDSRRQVDAGCRANFPTGAICVQIYFFISTMGGNIKNIEQ